MNKEYEDIEGMVQKYVLGKLSESETDQFEEYFLMRPDVIEMVEASQLLNVGLENVDAEIFREKVESGRTPLVTRALDQLLDWLTVPVPAFAVLLLGVITLPFLFNNGSLVNNEQVQGSLSLVSFSTDITRSASAPVTIDMSDLRGQPAILIKLKSVQHPSYKLNLYALGSQTAYWQSQPFSVGALRDSLQLLPLDPIVGEVRLEVVGIGSDLAESVVEFCHYSESCR